MICATSPSSLNTALRLSCRCWWPSPRATAGADDQDQSVPPSGLLELAPARCNRGCAPGSSGKTRLPLGYVEHVHLRRRPCRRHRQLSPSLSRPPASSRPPPANTRRAGAAGRRLEQIIASTVARSRRRCGAGSMAFSRRRRTRPCASWRGNARMLRVRRPRRKSKICPAAATSCCARWPFRAWATRRMRRRRTRAVAVRPGLRRRSSIIAGILATGIAGCGPRSIPSGGVRIDAETFGWPAWGCSAASRLWLDGCSTGELSSFGSGCRTGRGDREMSSTPAAARTSCSGSAARCSRNAPSPGATPIATSDKAYTQYHHMRCT